MLVRMLALGADAKTALAILVGALALALVISARREVR
jgi:hypothetical protein